MRFSSFLGTRQDRMRLFYGAILAVGVAVVVSITLGSVAHGSIAEPTNRAEAEARANQFCTAGERRGAVMERVPSAYGAYPTNVDFDANTGRVTYDINIIWRGCTSAPNYATSYAFAVTGYPANGLAICPDVGTYGRETRTHDCLKYVDSTYPNSQHAQLLCAAGRGEACVNETFWNKGIGIRQARPGGANQLLTIEGMTGQVPNWSVRTLTSGSHTFGRTSALCAYWQIANGDQYPDRMCQNFRISVSWTRFGYELTPTINTVPDVIEEAGSSMPVSGAISHVPGSSTNSHSDIQWELTRTVSSPTVSVNTNAVDGGDPCDNSRVSSGACETLKSGTTGSSVVSRGSSYTSGISDTSQTEDWPAGTRVCFQLSISRYGSESSQTGWRHSELRCAVVGKKPKVQVHGGSLQVGRAFDSSGLADSRVEGSLTALRSPTRLYGSWVEYGIFTPGQVQNVASGSGLSGGSTQSTQNNWSCLTFANAPVIVPGNSACNNAGPFGGYAMQNAQLPNIAARYPVTGTTPVFNTVNINSIGKNRVVTGSSPTLNITGGQLNKGQWLVINAGNRTVNINGDIRYNENAALQTASDIPQLVIIARDINISGDVEQVDAWLIATGSLVTCSDRGNAGQLRSVANPANLPNGYRLTTNDCDKQLTVNGPVIADTAWLRRTFGASGTVTEAGVPAEIFNLRPDAYIWAAERIQPDVYRTTNLSERPPRY